MATTEKPLGAQTIESIAPAYTIACADSIAAFTAKKAQRLSPEASLEEGSKLTACVNKVLTNLQSSPCDEIQKDYKECLAKGKRVPCKPIKYKLEECSAKHLGKLD